MASPQLHTKEQAATSLAFTFLAKQNTAVLATVSTEGRPNTSVVYYHIDRDMSLYFITKSNTNKYHNILTNPYVSFCVYDEDKRITALASGRAVEVKKQDEQVKIMNMLAKVRHDNDHAWLPPIAMIKAGKLVILRVEVKELSLSDFSKKTEECITIS